MSLFVQDQIAEIEEIADRVLRENHKHGFRVAIDIAFKISITVAITITVTIGAYYFSLKPDFTTSLQQEYYINGVQVTPEEFNQMKKNNEIQGY